MMKRSPQVNNSQKRYKDMVKRLQGVRLKPAKLTWKKWLSILGGITGLITILTFLINNFLVQPLFSMQETEDTVTENLVLSKYDKPPVDLVYSVSDNGTPQSEYRPSCSYTLSVNRKIIFSNPIIWAHSKTYYPTRQGCQLAGDVKASSYLGHRETDNATVTVWSKVRRSEAATSSLELSWELPHCGADRVVLTSKPYNNTVLVWISNPNNYHVRYLALVDSPPITVNNVYTTTIEPSVPSNTSVLSQISAIPKTLEIRSIGQTGNTVKVYVPVVVEIDSNSSAEFDVHIDAQPPTIALFVQPPSSIVTATPPAPHIWVLIVIAIVAIAVIAAVIVVITRQLIKMGKARRAS